MDPGCEIVYELGFNPASADETAGSPVFFHDDDDVNFTDFYAAEYEPMFVQPENSSLGGEALDWTTVTLTPKTKMFWIVRSARTSMSNVERATKMPCDHIYRSDCVQKWLQIWSTCPACRFALPEDEAKLRAVKYRSGLICYVW
ncbi:hypothetical protein MLD38_028017 [Melastoma candidum]|uniref:Uncharacterized protein n=1 Tax=Melastoma candidum TaxID=119954 RepID=A0ACB9N406_9MYRT|nr:hypothetical protein MLD38_028017 [Melastoma candidum]